MSEIRFLEAEWRNLVMLNYEVDPEILKPYLPAVTELDLWQGKALVSMVGFMFLNTKVLGIKWPWHVNFEEVNLRFYVRHFDGKVKLDNQQTKYLYEWKFKNQWNQLGATVGAEQFEIEKGSPEEFIFEHYWGYNRLNDHKTVEYQVEHVSWKIRPVIDFAFKANVTELYGDVFETYLRQEPYSAFFAEGSEVNVRVAGKISI